MDKNLKYYKEKLTENKILFYGSILSNISILIMILFNNYDNITDYAAMLFIIILLGSVTYGSNWRIKHYQDMIDELNEKEINDQKNE